MTNRLMKPEEVAAILGIETKTLYNWVYLGRIPHVKLGRNLLRFDEAVIREWMKKFVVPIDG